MSKGLNWREAKLAQLFEIAFNDSEARIDYKEAAKEEIRRRNQKRHGRVNFKERKVYPR